MLFRLKKEAVMIVGGLCVYVYVRSQRSAKFSALTFSKLAALLNIVLLIFLNFFGGLLILAFWILLIRVVW
jgi:hypothetical protein